MRIWWRRPSSEILFMSVLFHTRVLSNPLELLGSPSAPRPSDPIRSEIIDT